MNLMPNQYINKVVYGGNVLIDLTGDTVTAATLASGVKAHDKSGALITGTNTYDADTKDATAAAAEILNGKTAYVNGSKVTGTMTNNGAVAGTISSVTQQYTIPQGYHDGSGKVSIASTEQSKIIGSNIREGVVILGVTGTMSGSEDVHAEAGSATPATTSVTYTPATGFNYFSQFTVAAIPYTETDNAQGGKTVTIG
jgi:hypothetical protein